MMWKTARTALIAALTLLVASCGVIRGGEVEGQGAELRDGAGGAVEVVERINTAAPSLISRDGFAGPPITGAPGPVAPDLERRSVLHAIHLASYRSEEAAAAGWSILTHEAPDQLADLRPRVEQVDLGSEQGVFLRLKAGPIDSREEAAARCAALSNSGYYCRPVDFEGRDVGG